jgi:hypothetical protein
MGRLSTDAGTQVIASQAAPAGSAPTGRKPGTPRRWAALAAYLLAGLTLFAAYLRLSQTYSLNSDSANILLMGWDLLHGHLLLHGWFMSDVSFYPTEIPQYALLEGLLGLHMSTANAAAAMTYTLVFLLAVLLARSGATGRAALIRTLIAAGIMLAPQFGLGVFALDLSVGHVGTSVPLLLVWLLLDKMAPRWQVPVLTALLLAWVLVADPIAYVAGLAPLGLVSAAWVIRGLVKGSGSVLQRITGQWYALALGASAVAAAGIAWVVNNVLGDIGGYTVNRLPFYFTPLGELHNDAPAAWKVLEIFGANYAGLHGIWLLLAFLHLASVLVVLWALAWVARRFFAVSLVDQVLAAGIVLNVVLYMLTNASDEAAHEVAIIVPFGAALAARLLIRAIRPAPAALVAGDQLTAATAPTADQAVPDQAVPDQAVPAQAVPDQAAPAQAASQEVAGKRTAREDRVGEEAARKHWLSAARRQARRAGFAAGILVLAGYAAGFGYELAQPSAPPANTGLASWLVAHHLSYGLSGYWTSSSVTVDSGQRVKVRALMQYTLEDDLWMSNKSWYNPRLHYANFVVLDNAPGNFSYWEPIELIQKNFGRPAKIYHTGPYTIMVWHKNLLKDIPKQGPLQIAPGQLTAVSVGPSRLHQFRL